MVSLETPKKARPDDTATTPDAALAGALREGRVILGYGLTFDAPPRAHSACVLHPIGIAIVQPPDETRYEPLFHATGAVCNLPMLAEAAASSGFLNAAPDSDGILRRVPLLAELDGRVYPGLALAAVAAATGVRDMALRIANVNASVLTIDNRTVPVDGKGNLLLRYRGKKRTFPYFSAADVLAGQVARRGVARQDRVRRHHGARHARGGGDAARYAVRGRGSSGHGRR